ncbi:MAG: polysaccharide biosynthesis/export family protein [Paludibacteraceae bacterium]|nr:polysaccharide biosynthesis/export family protein [Paludibacteraceae bacterium]HOI27782.1 polysaccharide biosynthesis/export family protein [Paludibacteraceae bacterium]
MKFFNLLFYLVGIVLLQSCATPNVAYLQGLEPEQKEAIANDLNIKLRPEDKIMITVNSQDPLLTNMFNLNYVTRQMGTSNLSAQAIVGYTVNSEGNVDFPVLGAVHVQGMTRDEVAAHIKKELMDKNLVKDPVVSVEFMNLAVSVLGEVARPGRYSIENNRITLFDALSMAGDLTVFAKRENVIVQRDEDGKKVIYRINLNSGKDLYNSPAYYLQQNDVVYVEPNSTKARQATVNGNNLRSTSFWMSFASLMITIIVLVTKD